MRWVAMITMSLFVFLQVLGWGSPLAQASDNETKALTEVVRGNTEFAVDMYKRISAGDKDKNILLSPFSISTSFAMTYAGSRRNTERQMAQV